MVDVTTAPKVAPSVTDDDSTRSRPLLRLAVVTGLALAAAVGVLTYDIGPAYGSRGFWLVADLRVEIVATIVVVGACQGVATVVFQTATSNRILTPSIMGFEALYVLMQTSLIFFYGVDAALGVEAIDKVLIQSVLMVTVATVLYAWLFAGRRGSLHVTLLVGIVLGVGFGSASTLMQRMLTPGEFDVLSARLFGSVTNSNESYLPWAALIVGVTLVTLWLRRRRLDVVALGREPATNLGVNFTREVLVLLVLTAILTSVSTTMIGPLTFFGFIAATLSYQLAGSSEHRFVLPFSFALGVAMLLGGYFVLHHVLDHTAMLSVVIEFLGGTFFVIHLLRKGSM